VGQWWEQLGWDIYTWNRYEDPPESDALGWYELSVEEREAAAQLCYFRSVWDEGDVLIDGFPIERPEFRYRHWMELEEGVRDVVDTSLKYSALSWNVLGLDAIEKRDWAALTSYESEAAAEIGFSQLTWDCWQNHFQSYSWDDLTFYGLDLPYLALGWTELSWDGVEAAPPSKGMSWKDLSQEQRQVASELCFFRDNWDGLDMTPNNGAFPFPKVKQRYVQWVEQPADARRMAGDTLFYNKTTWNNLGTAEIEKRSWEELTEHQKSDAVSLGFYHRTWDCFLNHYRSYVWENIDRDSQDALQVLGWSKESWEEKDVSPSYDNEWSRLSEKEQSVAAVLCFFEDNWDGNTLEVVVEPSIEEGTAVEGGVATDGEGGSPNAGSNTDPDAQTTTGVIRDPNVDSVAGISNPTDSANSVGTFGTKTMMGTLSFVFGTFIQFLL